MTSIVNRPIVAENSNYQALKILRNSEVCQKTGLSPSTVWRYTGAGSFPPPIQLGLNRVGWIECEVDAWIEQKALDRRVGK